MSARDPAVARFVVIQLVRVSGVALVLLGLVVQVGRMAALAFVPRPVGFVLIALGLAEVFVLPALLARRWRSSPSRDGAGDERP